MITEQGLSMKRRLLNDFKNDRIAAEMKIMQAQAELEQINRHEAETLISAESEVEAKAWVAVRILGSVKIPQSDLSWADFQWVGAVVDDAKWGLALTSENDFVVCNKNGTYRIPDAFLAATNAEFIEMMKSLLSDLLDNENKS